MIERAMDQTGKKKPQALQTMNTHCSVNNGVASCFTMMKDNNHFDQIALQSTEHWISHNKIIDVIRFVGGWGNKDMVLYLTTVEEA
ncbi:unnamed protein product [Absidia cylindrospora]